MQETIKNEWKTEWRMNGQEEERDKTGGKIGKKEEMERGTRRKIKGIKEE